MRSILLFLAASLSISVGAKDKPNIVFILTDNHGAWTLGCYGNPDIQTPNIDALAKRGTRFVNAFCNNAVCSPTRATYLTGLMPSQHGVHNFLRGGNASLQMGPDARNTLEDFTSLPEILKKNGYACGLVGKWHLGNNSEPNEGMDDYWITMPHGGTATFHGAKIIEDGELRTEEEYLTTFWTKHALKFIDQEKASDDPFFLFLSYNGPYGLSRYQLEPSGNRWEEFYRDKEMSSFPRGVIHPWQFNNREYFGNLTSIRRYGEELSAVDDGVGAVMKKLEAEGLAENTIVIFAADQGWTGGQHGLWGMGDHTRPVNAREGSMRIPLIFAGPGIAENHEPEEFVSNYDFMSGMVGLLGLESDWPEKNQSPGRDISPILRGEKPLGWGNIVFYEYESLRCVRGEKWKYVERFGDGIDEFYAIDEDPNETTNFLKNRNPDPFVDKEWEKFQGGLEESQVILRSFFDTYSNPKYDLWKGGESQPKLLVWGDAAKERMAAWRQRAGIQPIAVDPHFNPPPFVLPDGLVAEVAAAPPLVEHPIMAAFDDRGRLFVAENAGLNLKKDELEAQKPNSIRVLTDSNNDGLFDESQVFADGLTFPQGALWLMDSLYVMSPPSLWRFTDTDDDGVADEREELVTGFDYTGNAADVHGPFLHPNGRIFWCHGRKGHDVTDESTGEIVSQNKGARIWSCWPDGSDVRVFAGGGMDNPVEVDFTDTGEIIGTVNLFYGRPRGDTLVHWLRGGAYPRYDQEAVVAEFLRTGPLLTEFHNFGHVAVSGMMRYRTGALNPAWKDNLFVTHFNTQEITRTEFSPSGSTFAAGKTESILQIKNPDVHLTDVLEDANGDLIVLDTGGWFRIGCPNSQVAKPEIPGAIYRIRKAGLRDRKTDFRGAEIDWEKIPPSDLVVLLDDERFVVRDRAITELAIRGEPAIDDLKTVLLSGEASSRHKQNAIWALSRLRFSTATDLIATALADPKAGVRHAAANAIASTRTWQAAANNDPNEAEIEFQRNERIGRKLSELVLGDEPPIARVAASALGAMADPNAVPVLLRAAGREKSDRELRHAAIFSLIEIGDVEATRIGLETENPRQVIAALWALEGMGGYHLQPLDVVDVLGSNAPELRETAIEIATRHVDWDAAIANRFEIWGGRLNAEKRDSVVRLAGHFIESPPMQDFLTRLLSSEKSADRRVGFEAIAGARRTIEMPEAWADSIRAELNPFDSRSSPLALRAIKNLKTTAFDETLTAIAASEKIEPTWRVEALLAMAKENAALSPEAFALLENLISNEAAASQRLEAARILSTAKLTGPQRLAIADRIEHAGPLEIGLLWKIFERTRDEAVGRSLAENLPKSSGFGNLNPAELRRTFTRLTPEILQKIEPHIAELETRAAQRADRLAALIEKIGEGDSERGRAHFLAGKGACFTCHKIGDDGRAIGPDLTTIGRIRTERDLLESILYPSESIARDFEAYTVTLVDDSVSAGLIQRETNETVFVTDATGEEKSVSRSDVKSIEPLPASMMPQGLEQSLSEDELLDLVAYLKSLR